MTPDLHVLDLLMLILDAWEKKTELLEREDFFVEFQGTSFGERLNIVAPVVRYEEETVKLRWLISPRRYHSDKEVKFRGEE